MKLLQNYKFTKRPITIEAFQMTLTRRADHSEWPGWLHQAWNKDYSEEGSVSSEDFPDSDGADHLLILHNGQFLTVEWGDYIIRGVQGELYPCSEEIFNATYDANPEHPDFALSNEIEPVLTKESAIRTAKTFRKDLDDVLQRMKDFKTRLSGAIFGSAQNVVEDPSETIAQHTLSIRDLESAIMRQGMTLKSIGNLSPYPESRNPDSTLVLPPADGLKL